MISVTHYMNREGQMLADVSPRRYFCTDCHVPQDAVPPLVANTFVDMSELGARPHGSERSHASDTGAAAVGLPHRKPAGDNAQARRIEPRWVPRARACLGHN